MSFGGFGQNNNQQQSTGFGGFGSNNNTNSGFGQPQSNIGHTFGGSTLFGSGGASGSTGGFGSGGTAFASTPSNASVFAQNRPAFGAPATSSSGGGLFGGGTATAGSSGGFSGFGTNNTNNASGGGLFGQGAQKPAFGSGNTGSGLFGTGNTGGGFGQNNSQTSGAFSTPILGQNAECQGTGVTPFQPFTEKEGAGSATNHFQSISCMESYKPFSFEELRAADYNGGRRFGNGSGQAGAFGQTNFGGGFGQGNNAFGQSQNSAGSGLFGQAATSSAPAFGSAQTAQSGFGTGSSGLFGNQNKPATGGLFGPTPTGGTGNSLFNNTSNTGTGFGTGAANTNSGFGSGGGLFGTNQQQQQQQQQSKPLFGNSTTATSGGFGTGGTGFGTGNATGNTGGGLFSNNQSNPFGQSQQQQQNQTTSAFPAFGQPQNQNQNNTTSAFGFGQAQQQEQKPGGLFGNQPTSNTGGGLFSNLGNNSTQQQPSGGGLFSTPQNNNQTSGSSLFKPATSSGLFNNNNTNTNNSNTGGGLFSGLGNNNANQNQQNQGGGLFSNPNNPQQKPGLFFNNQSNTGGGLFSNQQQGNNSAFGNNSQQQQPAGSLFGPANNNQGSSILGSQQQQQPNVFAPPSLLTSSLTDPGSAYGSPSIFSGLPPPPVHVGPIATPINIQQKIKRSTILPQYKMNPNAGSRMVTPQKRGGFGFSYSTYGTPASASSNASTPGGLSSSLLYGSVGRGLGKSLSTSNLRRNFDSDGESILTPGAFSAGSSRYGGAGSLKRLTIDRSLRTDLFGDKGSSPALPSPEKSDQSKQPSILKKKVSFDASTLGGNGQHQDDLLINGSGGGNGSDKENSATPSAEEQGFIRTPSRAQRGLGPSSNGGLQQSEMEQAPRGNELAIVHEDEADSSDQQKPRAPSNPQFDQQPGSYWMKPSEAEINKMTLEEKRKVKNFTVGRDGCGRVEFNLPVDLTLAPLNDIYDKIVLIELRALTVYPDQTKKPAQGKGLNVPSTLFLENSWPRQRDRKTPLHEKSGPRFQKHVDRLRKVGGTEFVKYDKDTGTWVFRVPHFTTYGFDYDDEASEAGSLHASVQDEGLGSSVLSEAPNTPTPKSRLMRNGWTPVASKSTQRSYASTEEPSQVSSSLDDTFQFRKKNLNPPGAFDKELAYDDDELSHVDDRLEVEEIDNHGDSFLDERSAASPSDCGEDEPSEIHEMHGALQHDRSLVVYDGEDDVANVDMVGAYPIAEDDGVLPPLLSHTTPGKGSFNDGTNWAEQLQQTISPKKQDRQALRDTQARASENRGMDEEETPIPNDKASPKIETHSDLMNSIYGQEQARRSGRNAKQGGKGTGLKWPYRKKSTVDEDDTMNPVERRFHDSYKPSWGPGATLLYAIPGNVTISRSRSNTIDLILNDCKDSIVSEGRDIRFAKLAVPRHLTPKTLSYQRANTKFTLDNGIPMASLKQTPFQDIASLVDVDCTYEKQVWELASILFDDQDCEAFDVPVDLNAHYDHRIRKDRLIALWERLCQDSAKHAVSIASTAEERAIAHLSAHKIAEACDALAQGKDFRLAILVAQIGGDQTMHNDMGDQIEAWRKLNVLSEMTEPVRTLYSLLASETCICEGKKGPPEDRARTFAISERFSLDWKRAFGLRLFYAILADDPIEVAVAKFANDLQGDEVARPRPPFSEDAAASNAAWQDPYPSQREDILWGLLKLYAASKSALPTPSIAETFAPQNTTGNPLDSCLSFQIYHALTLCFPSVAASTPFQADALTWTLATQLDSAGEWLWAIFALLHLSSAPQRHMAIQSLLAHHAADIQTEAAVASNEHYRTLTHELKIPPEWIFEAKALCARNVLGDHVAEVGYLVKAGDWEEAHEVLRKEVGPSMVIEEEWDVLRGIIDAFKDGRDVILEWGLGGQVYEDFLSLIKGDVDWQEKKEVLVRLLDALPTIVQGSKKPPFKEIVALQEISRVVGKEVMAMKEKGIDNARILQLPLSDDAYLKHTMDLSVQYYKAVMAK